MLYLNKLLIAIIMLLSSVISPVLYAIDKVKTEQNYKNPIVLVLILMEGGLQQRLEINPNANDFNIEQHKT